jgi:transcriptional regulator with XRE-family HTH domain
MRGIIANSVGSMNTVDSAACAFWQEIRIALRMQNTGMELKHAREQAGLSAEQIAERTKFKLEKIEALESGDFEHLPQGIYLDGIVRAYARELGLDAAPLVEQVRLERGKLPGDSPIPFHEPVEFERPSAAPETVLVPPVAQRALRPHSSLAVAVLALLVLLGWSAYFYEASRDVDRDTAGKNYLSLPAKVAPAAQPIAFTENAVQDVTGTWKVATHVESSSYASYSGLLLGYEMEIEQDGDRVTGTGRKILENGTEINPRGQTPITVSGVVDGDRLTLNFTERGARRASQGTFTLMRDADGMLRGRFTSDAAKSSGSVEARRLDDRS